jgi:hypothetical protein
VTIIDPLNEHKATSGDQRSVFSNWNHRHAKNKVSDFVQHANAEGARGFLNQGIQSTPRAEFDMVHSSNERSLEASQTYKNQKSTVRKEYAVQSSNSDLQDII